MIGQQFTDSRIETNCLVSRFLPTDETWLAFIDEFALPSYAQCEHFIQTVVQSTNSALHHHLTILFGIKRKNIHASGTDGKSINSITGADD